MPVTLHRENSNWIMNRAAKELATGLSKDLSNINYFLPYTCWKEEKEYKGIKVAFLTHIEKGGDEQSIKKKVKFLKVLNFCNRFICMNEQMKKELWETYGIRAKIIRPGGAFKRPITFGVCGKVHATGRKGEDHVEKLMENNFNFLSWGYGWPCPKFSDQIKHLEAFYKKN